MRGRPPALLQQQGPHTGPVTGGYQLSLGEDTGYCDLFPPSIPCSSTLHLWGQGTGGSAAGNGAFDLGQHLYHAHPCLGSQEQSRATLRSACPACFTSTAARPKRCALACKGKVSARPLGHQLQGALIPPWASLYAEIPGLLLLLFFKSLLRRDLALKKPQRTLTQCTFTYLPLTPVGENKASPPPPTLPVRAGQLFCAPSQLLRLPWAAPITVLQ